MTMRFHRIAVIAGDGIGKEVISEGVKCLNTLSEILADGSNGAGGNTLASVWFVNPDLIKTQTWVWGVLNTLPASGASPMGKSVSFADNHKTCDLSIGNRKKCVNFRLPFKGPSDLISGDLVRSKHSISCMQGPASLIPRCIGSNAIRNRIHLTGNRVRKAQRAGSFVGVKSPARAS